MGKPQNAIDLRHLRYFVAVSEELHFRRAAERLHISQPPLSQAIRKLEKELGVQLLSRTSRVVTLTPAGRVFAEEASKVLANCDRAVAEARRAGGAGAALRVGCVPYLPLERLFLFVGELHERHPNSHAEITHLSTLEQVRRLRDGELDLGIFYEVDDTDELEIEPLFPGEPLAAFLSPHHRLAAKQVLGPGDLREETIVTLPRALNPGLYDRMLMVLERAGFGPRAVREVGSANASDVLVAVANGVGIALLPLSFRDIDEAGRIVIHRALEPPPSMADMVVAWPANPPRQLRMVLATVREVARALRQGRTSLHPIETEPISERRERVLDSPAAGTGDTPGRRTSVTKYDVPI